MKYYITADGGGTKLLVILYDENFHILRSVRTAGTNSCFKPVEQITRETEELADRIARMGYNTVRIHHHERELCDKKDGTTIIPWRRCPRSRRLT